MVNIPIPAWTSPDNSPGDVAWEVTVPVISLGALVLGDPLATSPGEPLSSMAIGESFSTRPQPPSQPLRPGHGWLQGPSGNPPGAGSETVLSQGPGIGRSYFRIVLNKSLHTCPSSSALISASFSAIHVMVSSAFLSKTWTCLAPDSASCLAVASSLRATQRENILGLLHHHLGVAVLLGHQVWGQLGHSQNTLIRTVDCL